MQVLISFILLLTVVITVTAQPECLDGQIRLPEVTTLLEYCHHGEWRWICHDASQWNQEGSKATCEKLGYSDEIGHVTGDSQNGSRRVVTLSDCNGPRLTECTVTPSDSCNSLVRLVCNTVICDPDNSETRLVGGPTDREGRVEVCMDGRWRTVCTGSQDLAVLARGVCLRIGIESLVLEGSTVAVTKSFPHGAFPEYSLKCEQFVGGLRCSLVKQQCDSFVELEVVCKNYEDLRNECSRTNTLSTLSTSVHATMPLPSTTHGPIKSDSTCNDNSTTLTAGICVLVALLLAVSVGWIVSCVILLKRRPTQHKQSVDPAISTRSNQSYTQQHISDQLYDEAEAPDQTYSRLNRGQAQDHKMDDIATYDYADPNQIKVDRFQETNPPPVSGEAIVREEEFYIAEDHTYAAVNKKAKKKKKKENGEGDKNDSSL